MSAALESQCVSIGRAPLRLGTPGDGKVCIDGVWYAVVGQPRLGQPNLDDAEATRSAPPADERQMTLAGWR